MSLVGTRPPTVDEYEQYEIGHRKRGHKRYVIVGGVFGCVIAAGLAVRAIWYIVGYPISRMRPAITEKECKGIIW